MSLFFKFFIFCSNVLVIVMSSILHLQRTQFLQKVTLNFVVLVLMLNYSFIAWLVNFYLVISICIGRLLGQCLLQVMFINNQCIKFEI